MWTSSSSRLSRTRAASSKGSRNLGIGFVAQLLPEELAERLPVTIVGDIPNVDVFTRAWNLKYGGGQRPPRWSMKSRA